MESSVFDRRALVVDDDPLVTALVGDLLRSAGFEVKVADSANAATELFLTFDPDVAILDIELGKGPSGVDLAHIAHRAYPATALLLLTRFPDVRTAQLSPADLPPGCGFVSKSRVSDSGILLQAVGEAFRGTNTTTLKFNQVNNPLARLTRTQLAVLRMVVQGYTNPEIARRRACSTNAVEKLLTSIYGRLGIDHAGAVHPRAEAIRIWASASALPGRDD